MLPWFDSSANQRTSIWKRAWGYELLVTAALIGLSHWINYPAAVGVHWVELGHDRVSVRHSELVRQDLFSLFLAFGNLIEVARFYRTLFSYHFLDGQFSWHFLKRVFIKVRFGQSESTNQNWALMKTRLWSSWSFWLISSRSLSIWLLDWMSPSSRWPTSDVSKTNFDSNDVIWLDNSSFSFWILANADSNWKVLGWTRWNKVRVSKPLWF